MGHSILDDLGQEVTGIVSPVTICMFLTVCLVRVLNPDGTSNPSAVAIAQIYHQEKVSYSALRHSADFLHMLHSKVFMSRTDSS